MASSFRSAPATNWPGLPLWNKQPAQVGPLLELADQARELLSTACDSVFTFLSGRSKVTRPISPSSSSECRNALRHESDLSFTRSSLVRHQDFGSASMPAMASKPPSAIVSPSLVTARK